MLRGTEVPKTLTEIQVFVASPGDVQKERDLLASVIEELNHNWSSTLGARLRLLRWETDVHPALGEDPQSVINDQIGDDYDVFVGILWGRFGEPTPRAGSGTQEEFERALSRRKKGADSPEIMVYFKDYPIAPTKIDIDQLSKVQNFRSQLSDIGALYADFSDESSFQSTLRASLAAIARKFSKRPDGVPMKSGSDPEGSDEDDDFGYLDYVESYEARMADMTSTLQSIHVATEKMGRDFDARTVEVREFTESEDRDDIRAAKKIIKRAAEDMNAYGRTLDAKIPLLAVARDEALTSLTKALALYGEFGEVDPEHLVELRDGLAEFKDAGDGARGGLSGFRETISSMSRMTGDLNRAKKFVVRKLEDMDAEIERAQSASASILESIDQMLDG
ncbi:MAG: hypothetical protein CL553_12670 [Alcanivorax sp.]|nr:hypothetical protein [Alcanivorax sp.]|tara:strand:- start:381 stop:1556 length:1176 start_codon:yes stop_codon:yes gene_type:complete